MTPMSDDLKDHAPTLVVSETNSDAKIRIIIADDHVMLRKGFCLGFNAEKDMLVVAEAGTGAEALSLVERLKPDVLLLDLELPDMSGIDVLKILRAKEIDVKTLAVSALNRRDYIEGMQKHGAMGFIPKEESLLDLILAVRAVAQGGHRWHVPLFRNHPAFCELSDRDIRMLRHLAEGKSNKTIAEELYLSERTVRNTLHRIYQVIGVNSAREAIRWTYEHDLK